MIAVSGLFLGGLQASAATTSFDPGNLTGKALATELKKNWDANEMVYYHVGEGDYDAATENMYYFSYDPFTNKDYIEFINTNLLEYSTNGSSWKQVPNILLFEGEYSSSLDVTKLLKKDKKSGGVYTEVPLKLFVREAATGSALPLANYGKAGDNAISKTPDTSNAWVINFPLSRDAKPVVATSFKTTTIPKSDTTTKKFDGINAKALNTTFADQPEITYDPLTETIYVKEKDKPQHLTFTFDTGAPYSVTIPALVVDDPTDPDDVADLLPSVAIDNIYKDNRFTAIEVYNFDDVYVDFDYMIQNLATKVTVYSQDMEEIDVFKEIKDGAVVTEKKSIQGPVSAVASFTIPAKAKAPNVSVDYANNIVKGSTDKMESIGLDANGKFIGSTWFAFDEKNKNIADMAENLDDLTDESNPIIAKSIAVRTRATYNKRASAFKILERPTQPEFIAGAFASDGSIFKYDLRADGKEYITYTIPTGKTFAVAKPKELPVAYGTNTTSTIQYQVVGYKAQVGTAAVLDNPRTTANEAVAASADYAPEKNDVKKAWTDISWKVLKENELLGFDISAKTFTPLETEATYDYYRIELRVKAVTKPATGGQLLVPSKTVSTNAYPRAAKPVTISTTKAEGVTLTETTTFFYNPEITETQGNYFYQLYTATSKIATAPVKSANMEILVSGNGKEWKSNKTDKYIGILKDGTTYTFAVYADKTAFEAGVKSDTKLIGYINTAGEVFAMKSAKLNIRIAPIEGKPAVEEVKVDGVVTVPAQPAVLAKSASLSASITAYTTTPTKIAEAQLGVDTYGQASIYGDTGNYEYENVIINANESKSVFEFDVNLSRLEELINGRYTTASGWTKLPTVTLENSTTEKEYNLTEKLVTQLKDVYKSVDSTDVQNLLKTKGILYYVDVDVRVKNDKAIAIDTSKASTNVKLQAPFNPWVKVEFKESDKTTYINGTATTSDGKIEVAE
jgi:hypothetical protein